MTTTRSTKSALMASAVAGLVAVNAGPRTLHAHQPTSHTHSVDEVGASKRTAIGDLAGPRRVVVDAGLCVTGGRLRPH